MLSFLKYLIQLVLSPANGWEDIASESPQPRALMRGGLVPLLCLTAASEFCALFWERGVQLGTVVIRALVDFGAYFVAVYIARLVFDMYMERAVGRKVDTDRCGVLAVMAVGIMVLIQLVDNICPWHLILLRFLPLYAVLVLYKGAKYLDVPPQRDISFLLLATLATVVTPLAIYYLFFFILP